MAPDTTKTYIIASPEGLEYARSHAAGVDVAAVKVGDTVPLELTDDQELSLLAAGWLKKTASKGGAN